MSHGQAIRSVFGRSLVTHFTIGDLPQQDVVPQQAAGPQQPTGHLGRQGGS